MYYNPKRINTHDFYDNPGGQVFRKGLLLVLLVPILMVLSGTSTALNVTIDTTVPPYLLDGDLNLTGTFSTSIRSFTDDTTADFSKGTRFNMTAVDGSVLLKPTLDFKIQNNGNAVFTGGGVGAWDRNLRRSFDVIKVGGTYYMAYAAGGATLRDPRHIGMASSTDGITWTRHSTNPVIRSGVDAYDKTNTWTTVIYYHNNTWHMMYSGNKGNTSPSASSDMNICYANSSDGYNWTKYANNPVVNNGAPNTAWDGTDIRPYNVLIEGTDINMYYMGTGTGWGGDGSLALATSTDWVNWNKDASNPLFQRAIAAWYNKKTKLGTIEMANGTYRMWSEGNKAKWSIGWMSSDDGKDWADSGAAILTPKAGTIYSSHIYTPRVVDEGGYYNLWANCEDGTGASKIALFKVTPQKLNGTYTSQLFDVGGVGRLDGFQWSKHVNGSGNVRFEFRYGNSTTGMTTWQPLTDRTEFQNVTARYFQYRAHLRVEKDWMRAKVTKFSIRYEIEVDRVEARVNGGAWYEVNTSSTRWWENITLTDGTHFISVRVVDMAGNTDIEDLTVRVDEFSPVGNITIEEGKSETANALVHYVLEASDTHGIEGFMVSADPTFSGADWAPFYPHGAFSHTGPDGKVTLFAKFKDRAGRESVTYNDSIVVDTTPPVGTLVIDQDAMYATSRSVLLSLDWTDLTGVVAMMVSNDPNFLQAEWTTPSNTVDWELGEVDGVQRVYVRLKDAVGWVTDLTDSIILDKTPPMANLVINDDDVHTTTSDVDLWFSYKDMNPVELRFRNAGEEWPDEWQTLASGTTVPWTLEATVDGFKRVELMVRDAAGNLIQVFDEIVLDTTPPTGLMSIDGGSNFTNDLLVEVTLQASDETSGLDAMRVSNTGTFDGLPWQSMKESFDWAISTGDGTKQVFIQLRDVAGLTAVIDASIVLDQTAPSGSFTIENGATYVTSTDVVLYTGFTDAFGIADLRVSNEPLFLRAEWVAYSSTLPWTLEPVNGGHQVYIEVRDEAGNSMVANSSVTLDLIDPLATIIISSGAEATLELAVEVDWTASDQLGIEAIRLSEDPDFLNVEWSSLEASSRHEGTLSVTLTTGDGLKTIYLQVRDVAGRTFRVSDSIWYVSSRPEGTVQVGDGSGWTNSTTVRVTVNWTGGSEATQVRLATTEDDLSIAEWEPIIDEHNVVLSWGDGVKTVYAQLIEAHNVTSLPISTEVTLDTVPPTLGFDMELLPEVAEGNVVVNFSVGDSMTSSPALSWRIDDGDWIDLVSPGFEVSVKPGEHTIEVRAVDDAGNEAIAPYSFVAVAKVQPSTTSWTFIILIVVTVAACCGVSLWVIHRRSKDREV
jgi:hypothetical protein